MSPEQSSELARINVALLEAFAEAQQMLAENEVGQEFAELVRHARDLHVLLNEALVAAEPDVDPRVRELAAQMGQRLALLQDALDRPADAGEPPLQ